jgi:hypothetical protein
MRDRSLDADVQKDAPADQELPQANDPSFVPATPDSDVLAAADVPGPDDIGITDSDYENLLTEVMAGKWGRGQERRLRLKEAGHDHVQVAKDVVKRANKNR